MDDSAPPDYAQLWERLATTAHPSFTRVLAHAQEIRLWMMQAEQLSAQERERVLAHLALLEEMANRLATLTASVSNLHEE